MLALSIVGISVVELIYCIMNCYRTELVLFVFCSNSRMDWLIGTQFKLLMYLTMKADLKLLVRSRFMQFWDCRKKMRLRKK
jgi:hypothetical protein